MPEETLPALPLGWVMVPTSTAAPLLAALTQGNDLGGMALPAESTPAGETFIVPEAASLPVRALDAAVTAAPVCFLSQLTFHVALTWSSAVVLAGVAGVAGVVGV